MMEAIEREDYLRSRNRHPRNDAARFVENNIVIAGQSAPVYSERRDSFVNVPDAAQDNKISMELWKEADEEKDQLFATMEQVRTKLAKKAKVEKEALNLRCCKWEQVMQEVQTTATDWKTSAKNSKTMLCIDKVGRNSDVFSSWLELLPSGDYSSSICGVFKIAFEAAGQYSRVEEAIFETLSEIPEILESSRRYIEIYADLQYQSLEEKTFYLFRSILRTLIHVMKFFSDSKIHVQKMEDLSRRLIAFESGQTDNPTNLNRPSKAMALEMARTLLELIHFDQGVTSSDTASYLRMGLSLDERPKARAAAMVTNDRFKAFMSDELASSALLVNGHADLASVEGISPLSFVSAEFVRIAESTGRAFVTKFFCGQHPPRYGQSFPPSPSRGLMASLVGQLVSQMLDKGVDVDLSFLSQSDWHDIYGLELSTLCSVFRELTNQLPAQSLLLCIIDEITQYETTALANDINVIFKKLTRLVKRREDIIFKLLVTAHSRAMRISKHFVGQMLDLPEDIEADDSSGWHMTTMGDRREV
ncbi:hypothetical protein UCREL1_7098 [Eutypa lata UCREL1]|uniref:Phytanoyl-dioxygenase family protein n=1 Tax=Eutypa lata (strain UCR-EL1) TaxID=1287681 RepID=M7SNX2_EUTLA|nr:hypothetical protein UCREL1_7098 [Eutypa lata UCREL1]